ncbi:hypothetical protein AAFF_G00180560 [Aldrovandia affinis]|uniref:Uncharacterized protein n=1 Tax=Aldrovandia affinis TaxID=143900 RepID=A0AAD7T0C7_9TELE|nr:hypothetical protein AAFF_G00180560 [Aldrovandia affinis]
MSPVGCRSIGGDAARPPASKETRQGRNGGFVSQWNALVIPRAPRLQTALLGNACGAALAANRAEKQHHPGQPRLTNHVFAALPAVRKTRGLQNKRHDSVPQTCLTKQTPRRAAQDPPRITQTDSPNSERRCQRARRWLDGALGTPAYSRESPPLTGPEGRGVHLPLQERSPHRGNAVALHRVSCLLPRPSLLTARAGGVDSPEKQTRDSHRLASRCPPDGEP